MKIIATVRTDVFLVEATADELAKVAGYPGEYYYRDAKKSTFSPGLEVNINELYIALQTTRNRHGDVANLAKQLRATADRVDKINEALASPIIESSKS